MKKALIAYFSQGGPLQRLPKKYLKGFVKEDMKPAILASEEQIFL